MALRDDYDAIDCPAIEQFVTTGREEDLHLDFKNAADFARRDDRKSLAIALSGYANSDGGIIVWGVDARENDQGVDCASALQPLPDVQLCLTQLNTFTGQAVSPLVDGIIHKAIPSQNREGFCVSLIPASDAGPHMAKAGEDRYFKRNGSAFYRLEHFDLADMFGRRQRPVLSVSLVAERSGADIFIVIRNDGRGPAKLPYLGVDMPADYQMPLIREDRGQGFGLRPLGHLGRRYNYGGDAGTIIHVGQQLIATRFEARARTADGRAILNGPQVFYYEVAAEGVPLTKGQVTYP